MSDQTPYEGPTFKEAELKGWQAKAGNYDDLLGQVTNRAIGPFLDAEPCATNESSNSSSRKKNGGQTRCKASAKRCESWENRLTLRACCPIPPTQPSRFTRWLEFTIV